MTYDVYYLIYGVKLRSEVIKSMLEYVVNSGEYVEEIEEFTEEIDPDLIIDDLLGDDLVAELFERLWKGFDYPYTEGGQSDYYIGNIIWSTNNANWADYKVAKKVDIFDISDEKKNKIKRMVEDVKEDLPEEITNLFPKTDFYWIIGSS